MTLWDLSLITFAWHDIHSQPKKLNMLKRLIHIIVMNCRPPGNPRRYFESLLLHLTNWLWHWGHYCRTVCYFLIPFTAHFDSEVFPNASMTHLQPFLSRYCRSILCEFIRTILEQIDHFGYRQSWGCIFPNCFFPWLSFVLFFVALPLYFLFLSWFPLPHSSLLSFPIWKWLFI